MTEQPPPPYTLDNLTGQPPARKRPRWPWIAAGSATLAVLGIVGTMALLDPGGSEAPAAASATSAAPTSVPTTTVPTAPATTAPAPTATAAPRLGTAVTLPDGSAVVTALAYRQPVAKGAPKPEEQAGYVWGAAEVRVCLKVAGQTVSRYPWVLTYADGAVVEPSSTGYVHFPNPEYPWDDQAVKPGRCVRGWVTYPVPNGTKPAYVQYQPQGYEPIEWRVR